jgi:hypothetical protein
VRDLNVSDTPVEIRPARDEDRVPMAVVFAAVAEERDVIATEPPVDIDARGASWTLDGTFVAVTRSKVVGSVHVFRNRHGFGELAIAVAREWRGRGTARLSDEQRSPGLTSAACTSSSSASSRAPPPSIEPSPQSVNGPRGRFVSD